LLDEGLADGDYGRCTARNLTLNTSRNPADEVTQPAEPITSNDPDRFAVDVLLPKDVRHPSHPERQSEYEQTQQGDVGKHRNVRSRGQDGTGRYPGILQFLPQSDDR
jgi:hypothetical protein